MDVDRALIKVKDSGRSMVELQEWPVRAFPEKKKNSHPREYWRVLVRHRWIILACFLVTVISVAVATFLQRPVYKATATIKIDKAEPKVLKFEGVVPAVDGSSDDDYLKTQYKLLSSYSLAERVVALLQVDAHPEFSRPVEGPLVQAWTRIKVALFNQSRPAQPAGDPAAKESPVVRRFLEKLRVDPVPNTRLVELSFLSSSPELSTQVANAMAEAFVEHNLDLKLDATRHAGNFLARQIEEVRKKLQSSEELLQQFVREKQYLLLDEKQEQSTRQLSLLTDALMKARSERLEKEALYRQAEGQDFQSLPTVLEHPLIVQLKTEYYRLLGEYSKLSETFLPDYPKMVALKGHIDEVKARLDAEVGRIVGGLRSRYEATLRSERAFQASVDKQKQATLKANEDSIQYTILKHDVDINREMHAGLLQRLKETGVSAGLDTTNIQVVDRAKIPNLPYLPWKSLNIMIGAVLGLGMGVAAAYFFELFDKTVKSAGDVEYAFNAPVLALVPRTADAQRNRYLQAISNGTEENSFELTMHYEQASMLSEAIRHLRTYLLFSLPENPPKCLLLTSAEPGDGKTGIAVNLSIALAQTGAEVLLIDADMRHPRCHKICGGDAAPGLSDYLTGDKELTQVVKPTTIPRLHLLPAGQALLNTAELLSSEHERMRAAVNQLCRQFRHVIIDSPPVLGFTDATLLSTIAEYIVFVVRERKTSMEATHAALRVLDQVNAKLLGVVVNNAEPDDNRYHYGYYSESYRSRSEGKS